MAATDLWEYAARAFEPARRRWATPGELANNLDGDQPNRETPALELIDRELVAVADGDVDKLMLFAPPQSGKSQRVSRRFPMWLLDDNPEARVALVSYGTDIAVKWGRQVKRDIDMNPAAVRFRLRQDSKAAGRWETDRGGGMYCTGVGGALTGQPIDLLIIDDPVKDRAAAESAIQRGAIWDWWENVAKVRAKRTVLIQTRWHTNDLAGELLQREAGEWRVVSLPALADSEADPLGRPLGEELATPRWPAGHYGRLQATTSSYVWSSLYQQRPTAAEGGIFKRGDWQFWQPAEDRLLVDGHPHRLEDCYRFITMDLATSTRTSADWTVAAAWAVTIDGKLLLLDRVRERVPQTDHAALLAPLRQRWLSPFDPVFIESRMFGTTLVYALGRQNVPVQELEADVDKLTRALPAADLARQGRVFLPATAPWLDSWIDELSDFPHTRHDDQSDVMAYAARVALTRWLPMESADAERQRRAPTGEIDYMALPY